MKVFQFMLIGIALAQQGFVNSLSDGDASLCSSQVQNSDVDFEKLKKFVVESSFLVVDSQSYERTWTYQLEHLDGNVVLQKRKTSRDTKRTRPTTDILEQEWCFAFEDVVVNGKPGTQRMYNQLFLTTNKFDGVRSRFRHLGTNQPKDGKWSEWSHWGTVELQFKTVERAKECIPLLQALGCKVQ